MILGQALIYKTNKFLRTNYGIRSSVSYAESGHIGIIYSNDSPEMTTQVEKFHALIKGDDKKIKVLAYERDVQVKHLPFQSFSRKDVTFWGNYRNPSVDNFADIAFDFLICLDVNPGNIIQNLLAKSKAKCRVGICNDFESYNKHFELIIQSASELNNVDSVYEYIKNIR